MDLVLNYLNATAICGLLSLILLCLFVFRPSKVAHAQGKEAPMAAGAWPILGHVPLLTRTQTPHVTLGAMADKYGPLFTVKLGSTRALVINNWETAKECFTTNDIAVSSRPNLIAVEHMAFDRTVLGFAPYGSYWRELRKISTLEFLSNRRIQLQSHVRVSEVETSIKELYSFWSSRKNESSYALVDMKQWFSQVAFNMVLRMAAGKRYFGATAVVDENEAKRSLKAVSEFMRLMGLFTVGDAAPYLRWLDLGGHEKAMKTAAKELDRVLSKWLEEHRQNLAYSEKIESNKDFMDVMLSVLDGITIDGIDSDTSNKATTLAMILGGTETISTALTWTICLLLENPLALEKAQEEINNQIGEERCISESDINKLVYLQAIVKESLRLHPPAALSAPRECIEDFVIGGYHVKKGTRLITNLWRIQTDPKIWPDPMEFKPERFFTTHKEVDVKGHHFELLPFGGGRRICPGVSFALHVMHLALARFLHSFEILKPSSEPIDMTETVGLTNTKATPLEILLKPRFSPNYYETM